MRILREGVIPGTETDFTIQTQTDATVQVVASTKLQEVSQNLARSRRYTAVYNTDSLSQIDHILLSQGLWANVRNVEIHHGYAPFEVSDHWPVIVDIRTAGAAWDALQTQQPPAQEEQREQERDRTIFW